MVRAKVFVCAKAFDGLPEDTNFKIVEEVLPGLQDGGKLELLSSNKIMVCNWNR